jgi:hypothetical protein
MSTPPEPTQEPTQQPTQEPPADDREEKFWSKLRKEISDQLDAREKKAAANQPPGEQRTGRSTIFDEFAKFMGGPFAPRDRK